MQTVPWSGKNKSQTTIFKGIRDQFLGPLLASKIVLTLQQIYLTLRAKVRKENQVLKLPKVTINQTNKSFY